MNTDGKTHTSPLELATPSNFIGNPEIKSGRNKLLKKDLSDKANKIKTDNEIKNLGKQLK